MRLLICDDHVVFAESLGYALSESGEEVVAVTHGVGQLLEVLRRERVDVCLLDVRLGRETAFDRIGEVRAACPHTRIVLLTAYLDASMLAAGRAAGIQGIAEKSQPISEIVAMLHRVCAGQAVLPSGNRSAPAIAPTGRRAPNAVRHLAGFLTPRERQVLSALVRGDDTTKFARSLGITSATARCHVQKVLTKLGAHSRLEAATIAVRHGMIDPRTGAWLAPGNASGWDGHRDRQGNSAAGHRPARRNAAR
jgi:two-component system nitrate/nitrite response regulator NarL